MTLTHTGNTAAPAGASVKPPPHRLQPQYDSDALTANLVVGVLGIAAFAVSFKHVVQTADRAGQTGWVAYAIAVSVELMALGSVSEIRRRKRRGQPARWPRCVLILGVVMSLAANLAVAQSTPWGYVMAAWPSVAFLAAAGIIESRPSDRPPATAQPEPSDLPADTDQEAGASATGERPLPPAAPQQTPAEPDTDAGPGTDDEADPTQPPQQRPTRLRVMTDLLTAMRADPLWRPDYEELTRTTGYSRSWCEKRVAEARTLHQGRPEATVAEEPADRTAEPHPLSPIHSPRDTADRPVPPTAQPAPNPYEEPAREHHPPHTTAAA